MDAILILKTAFFYVRCFCFYTNINTNNNRQKISTLTKKEKIIDKGDVVF